MAHRVVDHDPVDDVGQPAFEAPHGLHRRDSCTTVVHLARETEGCLDFAITADLLDLRRVNVFERWDLTRRLNAFRGSRPSDQQSAAIFDADVSEYDVSGERPFVLMSPPPQI